MATIYDAYMWIDEQAGNLPPALIDAFERMDDDSFCNYLDLLESGKYANPYDLLLMLESIGLA